MLKQSVNLKLGQSLSMTPAMQQAIQLLQLSTLDLQNTIQEQLDSNLMLEVDENSSATQEATNQGDNNELPLAELNDKLPTDLPTDSQWEDCWETTPGDSSSAVNAKPEDEPRWDQTVSEHVSTGSQADGPLPDAGELADQHLSLREHMLNQLPFERFSDRDKVIAYAIIDSLRPDGLLAVAESELLESLQLEFPLEPVDAYELDTVRHRLQRLEPIGIASYTLQECLRVQLLAGSSDRPLFEKARILLEQHFDLLAGREYVQLQKKLAVSDAELEQVVSIIRSLNPRPGSAYDNVRTDYVKPDVFVVQINGQWQARLNPETTPPLRVNSLYQSYAESAGNSKDGETLRNHLQEARWFIKSLQNRNETLIKVASCIVERQQEYFQRGPEAMKPLVLREIAEAVDMHESTISRVTTRKYMHTANGVLEFKYFFSSGVGTSDGGECSATAIQAMIKKLISEEDSKKPLSDSKLASVLQDQGINIARRTVAKYREALLIPSSTDRRSK